MNKFKSIFLIINLKTIIVTVLAVVSTCLCITYDITADFPLTLIATAIIFPIVFSIGGAYKRRESVLNDYGTIKAHGRAIYFAVRDWMDEPCEESLQKCRDLLGNMLGACRTLFTESNVAMRENEDEVYRSFSELSRFIRTDLREKGLASGEVSRCNQFLSKICVAFDHIKHINQYRTPRSLRAFSDIFVVILPPLYGPYFAFAAKDHAMWLAYVIPILFSVVLVSLGNIQEHLEDPFDQVGADDVVINVELFVKRLD